MNEQQQTIEVTEDDYRTFVGKNADKYLKRFGKFSVSGSDSFAATWHWPACFFGPLWMFYRKLYAWGFLTGLIGVSFSVLSKMAVGDTPWEILFEILNVLTAILCGLFGYYLYFRRVKKKILRVKLEAASKQMPYTLSQIGGVQMWVPAVIIIIFIMGIVLAIALPAYLHYRKSAEATRSTQSNVPQQGGVAATQGGTESVPR